MKILGLIVIVLWILGGLLFASASRPGDDFGSGIIAWLVLFLAVGASLVLGVWAIVRWLF